MMEVLKYHLPQIQTQEEWRELLNGVESPVRYSTYDDTVLAFHRQVFAQAFSEYNRFREIVERSRFS